MERHHGDLEADAGEDEEQPEADAGIQFVMLEVASNEVEAGVAGKAEDVGDAHDEEGRGESAEDEVLHARLERDEAAALVGDEDVEGDGDELQRDEEEHEVVGRGEEHEADGGEERQGEEFAAAVRHRRLHFVAHPDDERDDGEEEEVEEFGRAVPTCTCRPRRAWGWCRIPR